MAVLCSACLGTGHLLQDACPLCDGSAFFHDKDAPFFVFLLAGQSNMVGRGTGAELDEELLDFVNKHAFVQMAYDIDKSGKEQANTTSENQFLPLDRTTQWSAGGCCHTHGPEWGIVKRLIELCILPRTQSDDGVRPRIYLIKYAMGSSTLHVHWSPEGQYYPQFISFTKTMLKRVAQQEKLPTLPRIDCFFWNQGDSDASGQAVMRDSYKDNLVNFLRCIWKEFAADIPTPFPFVPLQLHWKVTESKSTKDYRKKMVKVNAAMLDGCQELGPMARMAAITPEMELTIASKYLEDGHSGTAALFIEGQHLAKAFADLLNLREPIVL